MKIVILGATSSGLFAAQSARRYSEDVEITIVEQGNQVSLSPTPLYSSYFEKLSIHELPAQDVRATCKEHNIQLYLQHKITHIDRKTRTITCKDLSNTSNLQNHSFPLNYDVLLFAQDAEPMIPQIDGIHASPHVYSALRVQDLMRLQELLQELHNKEEQSHVISWRDFEKEDWLEMIENLAPDTNKLVPANRISTLKRAHQLGKNRTYESSKENVSALVIGAGLLGMQYTQSLVNMNIHVHLVDMQSSPLYSMHDEKESLDEAFMHMFKNRLEFQSKRVECHWKNTVKRMAQEYSDKLTIELHDGTLFYVNFVLLACGFKNDTQLAKQALLPVHNEPYGALLVNDKTMQCVADDHVYGIGEQAALVRVPPQLQQLLHATTTTSMPTTTTTTPPSLAQVSSNLQQMSQLYSQLYDLKWWLSPVYHQSGLHHRMARIAMEHVMNQESSTIPMHSIHTVFIPNLFELSMGRTGLSEHHIHLTKLPFEKIYYHHTSNHASHFVSIQLMFDKNSCILLGAQLIGHYSLQATIQAMTHVLSVMIDKSCTVYDLQQAQVDLESDPWMQALLSAGEMAVGVLKKTHAYMDPCKLLHWNLKEEEPIIILDQRPKHLFDKRHFHASIHVPNMTSWLAQNATKKDERILVICQDGKQSHVEVRKMLAQGWSKAVSLAGGFDFFTKIL